jgi:hypothetical protein
MTKKMTTEEFIRRGKAKWGGRFDYSSTVYINRQTRVKIKCPVHGDVEVLPESHLMNRENNTGCPKCGSDKSIKKRSIQFDQFKKIAEEMFDGKYEYLESSWKGIKHNVDYSCPIHGKRSMLAESHISAREGNTGCKLCGIDKRSSEIRMSFGEFLAKARQVHGEKYEYDESSFKDAASVVTVKCQIEEHGYFFPVARDHLGGTECPACRGLKKKTTQIFVRDAKRVHGETYDYSKSEYDGARKKVVITCSVHGDFLQEPANHVNGSGCPSCSLLKKGWDNLTDLLKESETHLERSQLYIYSVIGYEDQVKVGICTDHRKRSYAAKSNLPYGELISLWECDSRIHARFIELAVLQDTYEQFDPPWELGDLSGFSELRKINSEDMIQIVQSRFEEFYACVENGGIIWQWAVDNIKMPSDIKVLYQEKIHVTRKGD